MPQFRVQIFKKIGATGKEWSNSYHVREPDLPAAATLAADIAAAEISIHKANVQFVRYRVSTETVGDNTYTTVPLNVFGAIPVSGGQLPLFNTVRADFAVFGGRPSYKYLRLPIEETETENGSISFGLAGTIETEYLIPLVSLSAAGPEDDGIVDESGNRFTSATVKLEIQERQLRRRKRSKSTGGLSGS